MLPFAHVTSTGVYRDEATQCFEAWLVDPESGQKRLVSSCSTCVPGDQYHWWVQQVWTTWLAAGNLPLPAAA